MASLPRRLCTASGNSATIVSTTNRRACFSSLFKLQSQATQLNPPTVSPFRRHYAQEASPSFALEASKQSSSDSHLSWPTPNSSNPYEIPTPYQIFCMSKDESYSKRRFYELVKIYHPDRVWPPPSASTDAPAGQLSRAARLERYRMVIAANELLSDPRRRKLYDQHDVGWSGKPEFGPSKPRWADTNNRYWSGFDDNVNDSPRHNATWEDWEKWHMRRERTHGEQRETFTSNGIFVAILVIFAGFATVGESVRMAGLHHTVVHDVEQRHGANSRELVQRRQESHDFMGRDERMRRFLLNRGPVGKELQIAPVGQEKEGSAFVPDHQVGKYSR